MHRHAFSAPEIYFLAKKERAPVVDVAEASADAGHAVAPGRRRRDPRGRRAQAHLGAREGADGKWAEVHRAAHRLGMPTTATMMFGVGETHEQRLAPPRRRAPARRTSRSPRAESFTAFIPWTFQEENTALDGTVETAGGFDYLRTLALSRLYLDNVPHVQGSWVTQGKKIGRSSLVFGADDLGSIMIEENVVAAAGAHNRMKARRRCAPSSRRRLHAGPARLGLRALPRGLLRGPEESGGGRGPAGLTPVLPSLGKKRAR